MICTEHDVLTGTETQQGLLLECVVCVRARVCVRVGTDQDVPAPNHLRLTLYIHYR